MAVARTSRGGGSLLCKASFITPASEELACLFTGLLDLQPSLVL